MLKKKSNTCSWLWFDQRAINRAPFHFYCIDSAFVRKTNTHTHIERNYRFVIHNWTYFSDLHHKSRDLFLGRNVMCHIRLFIGLILFSLMVLNQYRYFACAIEMLEMQSFIRKDGYWVWFNDIHRGQFSVRRHFFPDYTKNDDTKSRSRLLSLLKQTNKN